MSKIDRDFKKWVAPRSKQKVERRFAGACGWKDWNYVDATARKIYSKMYRVEMQGAFDDLTAYKKDYWRAITRAAMKVLKPSPSNNQALPRGGAQETPK